jgi:hypothetical protein
MKPELLEALGKAECPYCQKTQVRVLILAQEGSAQLFESKNGEARLAMSVNDRIAVAGCRACGMEFDPSRANLPESGW